MKYYKQRTLADIYDLSRSTAYRICKQMKAEKRGVRVIAGEYRYDREQFERVSNERRGIVEKKRSPVLHTAKV